MADTHTYQGTPGSGFGLAQGSVSPKTDVADNEAAAVAQAALKTRVVHVSRQTLTQSGNAIFRVQLADGRAVAVRINPHRGMFSFTQHNLDALRELGLPVPHVLASGATPAQGSFIILEWVPGQDLQYELDSMSAPQMTRVAETVTGYQQRVASLPESKGFGWAPIRRHATTARWTHIFGLPSTEEPREDAPALEHVRARLREVQAADTMLHSAEADLHA